MSAADVRRIAAFAGISVLLVGRDGLPLYLGRAERLGSQGQRRALEALYETCAVETCQTPGHLCEIHHLDGGWQAGVPTDIDKLVLACKWHNCWFNDQPDQILESRDSRGRTIITILPPPWASGRGFKAPRRPAAHTDLSAYDKPSTSSWIPTTGATTRSVPHVRDLSAHGTIVTRGPPDRLPRRPAPDHTRGGPQCCAVDDLAQVRRPRQACWDIRSSMGMTAGRGQSEATELR